MSVNASHMRLALSLAEKACGFTSPNPLVGAVLVKEGRILSIGHHEGPGLSHAEVKAIEAVGEEARGATLYVNLEPCNHFGKTPPCTKAILESGIAKVVVATRDPNPSVEGGGIEVLEKGGVEVNQGILEAEARHLNRVYFKYIVSKIPWVTLKVASTLDAKIAKVKATEPKKERVQLSGEKAQIYAQQLRLEHDAVMVGAGTVMVDNPKLTVRLKERKIRQPLRVVADSHFHVSPEARVFSASEGKSILATIQRKKAASALEKQGVEILECGEGEGGIDLAKMLRALGERGVTSLLVEGGAKLHTSFWKKNLADEAVLIFSPSLLGSGGLSSLGELFFPGEGLFLFKQPSWEILFPDAIFRALTH